MFGINTLINYFKPKKNLCTISTWTNNYKDVDFDSIDFGVVYMSFESKDGYYRTLCIDDVVITKGFITTRARAFC